MRALIACNVMSIDSYYEGPGSERDGAEHGRSIRPSTTSSASGRGVWSALLRGRASADNTPGLGRPALKQVAIPFMTAAPVTQG